MPSTPEFPHQDKLSGVHVITIETASHIQPWIDAITSAGAKIEKGEEVVVGLQGQTSQKIAVIMSMTHDETIQRNIDFYEALFSDPTLSVRYFLFMNDGAHTHVEHDRLRVVPFMSLSPHDCIEKISRSLYKARLPMKLRKGFDVEITEEILESEQVRYRKVIFRTHTDDTRTEIKYETTDLYIHNKELYELRDGKLVKLPLDDGNDPLVHTRLGRMAGHINLIAHFMDKKAVEE